MSPASSETIKSPDALPNPAESTQDAEKLREQYKKLLEKEKAAKQAEAGKSAKDRKTDSLSDKDIAVMMKFLNSPDSFNAQMLAKCIANFEKSKQSVGRQVGEYRKQLEEAAKKGEFSPESVDEYLKWFHEDLSYQEREQHLKNKSTSAHSPERAKVLKEANDLYAYFTNPASKKITETQKQAFLKKDLNARKKEVAEMKIKKKTLEEAKLPHVVRDELKGAILQAEPEEAAKIIRNASEKHQGLKTRFLKLPRMVQAENRDAFKNMGLNKRADFLKDTEQKAAQYTAGYRSQIEQLQHPDQDGLTLFSDAPESQTGSSAHSYMKWFENDLTLAGMQAAVAESDLKNPERKTVQNAMRKQLPKIPEQARPSAIKEFNGADLDQRKLIIQKWQEKCKKTEGAEGGNVVTKFLKRLFGSSANNDVERPMEAWAVMNEIATERRRHSMIIGHSDRKNATQEAAQKGERSTVERTQRVIGAVHDEKLKTREGKLRLKADTLQATPDAITGLKRTLKQVGVDDPNQAQLAGDIQLVNQSGDVIIDEREFMHGELERQLKDIRRKVAPHLRQGLKAEGLELSDKHLEEQLKAADWAEIGKDIIKKAA